MYITIIKISYGKTTITFGVSYNANSVSKFNPGEPNVSFSEQKIAL